MDAFDLEEQMLIHAYAVARQLAYDSRVLDSTYTA